MTIQEIIAVIPLDKLQALVTGGVFEMRSGSMEIHYDKDGNIRKIEKHSVSYFA